MRGMPMKHTRIQIPPCRPYEINAAQSWLSDMSAAGLHPEHDFIFAGLAFFERGEERRYRYRFDIAKPSGFFDDGGVDEEQQQLCAAAGWELVGLWGDFSVFRAPVDTEKPIPELHTDPALHAAAYKKVRRRAFSSLIWVVILAVVWLGMMLDGGAVLDAVLGVGLVNRLLSALLILWALYLGVDHWYAMTVFCRRLQNRARGNAPTDREERDVSEERDWGRRARRRRLAFLGSLILISAWMLSFGASFLRSVDDSTTKALAGNEDSVPFALMQQLYPDADFSYSTYDWSNEIRTYSDLGIPVHLQVLQNGVFHFPDGTEISGGMTIRYIETVSETFSALLYRQYRYNDAKEKYFDGFDAPTEAAAALCKAYGDAVQISSYHARFPTVLIRYGKKLLHITYYNAADITPDTVIAAMASDPRFLG